MDEPGPVRIPLDDPAAIDLAFAVRGGDIATVRRLLAARPELASASFFGSDGGAKTALHMVTDWPGYFPRGPEIARMLLAAGADPDIPTAGGAPETPLHWAASSDDAAVAEVLIKGGAGLETEGGSIGTPLANAVGYGCWQVARLLVASGAPIGSLWEAAALGDIQKVTELLASEPPPGQAALDQAFWHSCQGGQRRMAEYLLDQGADISFRPEYAGDMTALEAVSQPGTQRQALADYLRSRGAVAADPAG